jgi:hypothetical protein
MVLSIEQHIFLVEYVFREGSRYTDLVQEQSDEKSAKSTVYRDRPRTLKLLVTRCTNNEPIQELFALPTLYLHVLYLSEYKQRLVPLTA